MIRLKEGVRLHGMTEQCHWGMRQVDEVWKTFAFYECWVTSVSDGKHSTKSLHPHGRAFDVRRPSELKELNLKLLNRCREVMPGFDCLYHGEPLHFHFEWDPKS